MAWEQRSNRRYYYRKRREGRRVISEYVGSGELAEASAALRASERASRRARRRQWAALRAFDAQVGQVCDLVQALAHGALLVTGHRLHKGQWRKARRPIP
jgi:hypothetical protein